MKSYQYYVIKEKLTYVWKSQLDFCQDVSIFFSFICRPFFPQFFPYILLSLAILLYIPALLWRFTAAPHLSSDLSFIMEELDRFYNRAIRLAKNLASLDSKDAPEDTQR